MSSSGTDSSPLRVEPAAPDAAAHARRRSSAPLLLLAVLLLIATIGFQVLDEHRKARADQLIDIQHYFVTANAIGEGKLVHRDFDSEYPAAASIIQYAPIIGAPGIGIQAYLLRFIVFAGVTVGASVLWVALRAVDPNASGRIALIGAAGMFVGAPLILERLDGVVGAITMIGAALLLRSRSSEDRRASFLSGLTLSVAGSMKLFAYPAMLVLGLRQEAARRSAYWWGVVVGTIPSILLAVLGTKGFLSFLSYHSVRKVEVGSIYAIPWLLKGGADLRLEYGSIQIRFAAENAVVALASLLTVLATIVPIALAVRSRATIYGAYRFGALAIFGFTLFNKVGSPQYAAWIFLLLLPAAIRPSRQMWTVLGLALAYLTCARLSLTFFQVETGLGRLTVLFLVKHLLAILLYVALWRWALTPRTSEETSGEPDPRLAPAL